MVTLTAVKARAKFSEVVSQAAFEKERIVLTRNGKELAAVVPVEDVRLLEDAARAQAMPGEVRLRLRQSRVHDDPAVGVLHHPAAGRHPPAQIRLPLLEGVADYLPQAEGAVDAFPGRAGVPRGPVLLLGREESIPVRDEGILDLSGEAGAHGRDAGLPGDLQSC